MKKLDNGLTVVASEGHQMEVGRKLFASRTQTAVVGGDASKVEAEVSQFGAVKRTNPQARGWRSAKAELRARARRS